MDLGPIAERAAAVPDALAVTDGSKTLSWSEAARCLEGLASRMASPATSDRVGVTGENAAETLLTHAAGLLAGIGTVALPRQVKEQELIHHLQDSGSRTLVTGRAALEAALTARQRGLLDDVIVHGEPPPAGCHSWREWASPQGVSAALGERPARPLMVFTSGTTGRTRATEVQWADIGPTTTAAEYVGRLGERQAFPPGPHLVVGPLQHNGPLTSIRHLLAGQPVIVLARFEAAEVLRLIDHYGVTSSMMVPTHFSRLLALPEQVRQKYDVSSLRLIAHTGSACPANLKRAMIDWVGPVLVESYGGSELGTVCRIGSLDWLDRPGSVGRAVDPLSIAAYDESARPLTAGEVGVLGVTLPPGREVRYVGDPEKTARAYLAPGVATLGDVGYVDEDGFVFITDRLADMVVSGGVNLYPAESEQVLMRYPGVKEVAVIGVPDLDMGEALRALVVPEADAEIDVDQLSAFCRQHLSGYKCPRSYELVVSLARNDMGKLDKRSLRRPYWASERTIG
jgi:acyl-CoA synthetase (AMP-forming)/AMP-acid ligase II